MGGRHALRLAALAAGAADFIQQHPQAAEFFARKLASLLERDGREELEREREREDEAARLGRSPRY
jgi:hypothetical protein